MILTRYLLAQIVPPFVFGLALFSGVLVLDKVFDLIDLLANKGVSFFASAKMFLLFVPTVFSLTVPMAVLLACLLTFGRLSEDSEITALRASGLSFIQILWPPLAMAFLLCSALVPFNTQWVPKAMSSFRDLYHSIVTADPLIKIEPQSYLSVHNMRLYAREVAPDREALREVFVYQFSDGFWQRIFADRGRAQIDEKRLFLHLEDGQLERLSWDDPDDVLHVRFSTYTLSVPFLAAAGGRGKSLREMTAPDLQDEVGRLRLEGLPSGRAEAEFALRYAISFAPAAMALLGIPLGLTLERGGRGVGLGASLIVVFGYYLILILSINLAERQVIPAFPGIWAANALTAGLGLFLIKRRTSL